MPRPSRSRALTVDRSRRKTFCLPLGSFLSVDAGSGCFRSSMKMNSSQAWMSSRLVDLRVPMPMMFADEDDGGEWMTG